MYDHVNIRLCVRLGVEQKELKYKDYDRGKKKKELNETYTISAALRALMASEVPI